MKKNKSVLLITVLFSSSILTGCLPVVAGVVANEFNNSRNRDYERQSRKEEILHQRQLQRDKLEYEYRMQQLRAASYEEEPEEEE